MLTVSTSYGQRTEQDLRRRGRVEDKVDVLLLFVPIGSCLFSLCQVRLLRRRFQIWYYMTLVRTSLYKESVREVSKEGTSESDQ